MLRSGLDTPPTLSDSPGAEKTKPNQTNRQKPRLSLSIRQNYWLLWGREGGGGVRGLRLCLCSREEAAGAPSAPEPRVGPTEPSLPPKQSQGPEQLSTRSSFHSSFPMDTE